MSRRMLDVCIHRNPQRVPNTPCGFSFRNTPFLVVRFSVTGNSEKKLELLELLLEVL